eukprot:TRINITY_DN8766_c0_g1_i5.p1 TRINITY_DN8766_c0_g1~~TRINITY_DN8766_c0_g1_i5.p1  ORF type:complete len:479 (-),score=119.04 TRINITY_DN8766_c0_g1_i5:256-1692(-)
MGCGEPGTMTKNKISLSSTERRPLCNKEDDSVRSVYSLKQVLSYNATTGIFSAEETGARGESVFIRISRVLQPTIRFAMKRLDVLRANKEQFTHLLPYTKVEQKKHFLYLMTKTLFTAQDIISAVISNKFLITESNLHSTFTPIFSTLAKMHGAGIIHGQISPIKLLLINGTCYLYDPCVGTESTSDRIKENFEFLAPEDLMNSAPSFESDVWSLGAVLYYLITGSYVFNANSYNECFEDSKVSEADFSFPVWTYISAELKDLLRRMLTKEKFARITMREVVNHQWLHTNGIFPITYLLNNSIQLLVDYKRESCTQKTKYFMANDKLYAGLKEIQKRFKEIDVNGTGYVEYGDIVKALKGNCTKCEYCDCLWKYPIEYQGFLNDVVVLNLLVMEERMAVLFSQLAGRNDCLQAEDIKRLLSAIAHSDYAVPGVFEDLVRAYQNPHRESLTLNYSEFLNMMQSINFTPSEGLVIGNFFG